MGGLKALYSNCCQILLSLLERCPLANVLKTGTTALQYDILVHTNNGNTGNLKGRLLVIFSTCTLPQCFAVLHVNDSCRIYIPGYMCISSDVPPLNLHLATLAGGHRLHIHHLSVALVGQDGWACYHSQEALGILSSRQNRIRRWAPLQTIGVDDKEATKSHGQNNVP